MAEHIDARPVNAYILVKVESGEVERIAERLAEQVEGANVRRVSGIYDIVVAIEADGEEYLTRTLHDKVRPVSGIVDAEVLVWYDEGPTAPAHGQELHRGEDLAA